MTVKKRVPEVLDGMKDTFKERAKLYGNNYYLFARLMTIMYPDGVVLATEQDWVEFDFFHHIISKLSRFVATDRQHIDSIHDLAVYATMLEATLRDAEEEE